MSTMLLASPTAGLLEAMITTEGVYKGRQVFLSPELVTSAEDVARFDAAADEMVLAARQMAANAEALTESLDRLHETFVAMERRLDE